MNGSRDHRTGRRRPGLLAVLALVMLAGCGEGSAPGVPDGDGAPVAPVGDPPHPTLLTLGDSYTVGQSLPSIRSWPAQLADSLAAVGDTLRARDIVARSGWTTRDLLDAVRDSLETGGLRDRPYGLVTLMIGVNNQFRELPLRVFEAEFDTLVALSLALAGDDPARVLGFSIPDYSVTPFGGLYDTTRVQQEIGAHNDVVERILRARAVTRIDITPLSLLAASQPELVARDGLHYSGEMYRRWVSLMLPAVRYSLGLANDAE